LQPHPQEFAQNAVLPQTSPLGKSRRKIARRAKMRDIRISSLPYERGFGIIKR
jgi:hypothetical protein